MYGEVFEPCELPRCSRARTAWHGAATLRRASTRSACRADIDAGFRPRPASSPSGSDWGGNGSQAAMACVSVCKTARYQCAERSWLLPTQSAPSFPYSGSAPMR